MTATAVDLDGRRLRRERNRDAVLDALVDLYGEGNFDPSADDIAQRAGLSPRSLFRYFDDVDDLNRAAIQRQLDRARPLLDPGVKADAATPAKIEALVEARMRLYETIAPSARSARACAHRHQLIAAQVDQSRSYLRSQVRRLFGPELTGDRAALLPAIDALLSFESYDLLRRDQGLSRPKTVAALTAALNALLSR